MAVDPRASWEAEDRFAATSQRTIRAALVAQIAEAERLGLCDMSLVSQYRACVARLDRALASFGDDPPAPPAPPRLRLVRPQGAED